MTAINRPIKRPGLRAALLNAALRKYVKEPAKRAEARGLEVSDELLARGARRTAKAMRRNERVPSFVTVDPLVIPTPAGDMDAEWVHTTRAGEQGNDKHVILYLHGGGYFMCSAATHRPLTSRLAHGARRRVLAINYRQAPEHKFPAWLDDAVSAYRFLLAQGYDPKKISIGGDSAGGNLTLITLQQLRTEKLPMPGAAFCISPWACMAGESESLARNAHRDVMFNPEGVRALGRFHAQESDLKHPLISPVNADYTGFPPMLIQASSTEVLRDDSRRVAMKARADGVPVVLEEWHGLPHVFHLFADFIPEAGKAIRTINAFVQSHA